MNKKAVIIAAVGIIALCISIFILILATGTRNQATAKTSESTGGNAYVDPNAGDWDVSIPDSPSGTSDSSLPDAAKGEQILVPGYSYAEMTEGDTTLKMSIGNPKENTCCLTATLMLEDGTQLYESGLLEPGKGLTEIPLNKTLSAGTYKAYIHFQGYSSQDTSQKLNSADSGFQLIVDKKS